MGRSDYSTIGYGMTEREALRDAMDSDSQENGHREGYSGSIGSYTTMKSKCIKKPKIAKRCKVDKESQKGTRKWVTKYVVTSRGDEWGSYKSQTEAIKKGKELALKHNARVSVRIEKELDNGSNFIASISPNNSEQGQWRFWGEARC